MSDSDASAVKDKKKSKLDYAEERRKQKTEEQRAQKERKSRSLSSSHTTESELASNFTKPDKPVVKELDSRDDSRV